MKLKEFWRLVRHAIRELFADASDASDGGTHGDGNAPAPEQETQAAVATTVGESKQTNNPPSATTAAAPAIRFDFGGVKASPAEDSRCRISGLKVGSGSLSFRWDTKIPSDWKRGETKKGPMILACAFYWDGSGWVGGKFDWIDEHRTSRSLENIHDGYGGWNAAAWDAAKRRAFCVMSADGRHRSNLLETD